jgi:exosortase B
MVAGSPWPTLSASFWGVALALAALILPTCARFANQVWSGDDNAHGPIVLAVVIWIVWKKRLELSNASPSNPSNLGWIPLLVGLVSYTVGRSQGVATLEMASHIATLCGLLLLFKGWASFRAMWFPLLFMIFLIPLPGFFIDAVTAPLKSQVSVLAEDVLYQFGYPIARNGVVLSIGQYQLLVADACSGLHSMYSLSALGLLYLYMMGHVSRLRNGILLASILPIAFTANVIRVLVLVLVTYYFGDATAQGFLHKFAGMILFIVALFMLFSLDGALGRFRSGKKVTS